ncbi:MAG: hypothetical protein K2Y39_18170 [Candidatus Obscuribacterales bacterium]|nr:hypothetical protein [Candidatus Obscuribacterales bacterium]
MNSQQELDLADLQSYLDELRSSIISDYSSTIPIDHHRIEDLIDRIYAGQSKPTPEFHWFSNPRDLLAAAEESGQTNWLSLAKIEDKGGLISRKALEKTISSEDFDMFFRALWESLPERELRSLPLLVRREIVSDSPRSFQEEAEKIDQRKDLMQVMKAMLDRQPQPSPFFDSLNWASSSLLRLAIARCSCEFFEARIESEDRKLLEDLQELARSAHAYMFSEQACYLSERPVEFHMDEQARTHREDGPAVIYEGDFKIFCWKNTRASQYAITVEPNLENIFGQENVEIRRVLIDRYGIDRYILDSGAEIIQHDRFGTLYRKTQSDDEPIVLVRITNSSPEPDGSFRTYFLRVPPETRTAREAIAWTFRMTAEEYDPEIET